MGRGRLPRTWAIFGVGVLVVVVMGLLLALIGRGPGGPGPMMPPDVDDPTIARVNDRDIPRSTWLEAVLLDQVMSGLAGQPAPTAEETLQRLINEELVLQAIPPEQAPTDQEIETRIAALEETWGVDDDSVVRALEEAGLTRKALKRSVERLLIVHTGQVALGDQGYEIAAWLAERRASADIQLFRSAMSASLSALQSPPAVAKSPILTVDASVLPTPTMPTPEPTSVPAADTPTPVSPVGIAQDFTLERSDGGTLTLSEQLAKGQVVLVFFQRCG